MPQNIRLADRYGSYDSHATTKKGDHLLSAQDPPERREAVRDRVMHTLEKVVCHSFITTICGATKY